MLIGAGGTGSVCSFIQPMPFWNLVVIVVGIIIAISIISYSIHAILNSDKKSRNLDGIIASGFEREIIALNLGIKLHQVKEKITTKKW